MIKSNKKGFSLIELLVVITILSVISVVAYTSFSGSTDKAKNSKKLTDLGSIETGLGNFFQEKNYYPMPSQFDVSTNVWGYKAGASAQINNTFTGSKQGAEFDGNSLSGVGGGAVYLVGASTSTGQIGAKGTLDKDVLTKQYLSTELADPALKDIKVGNTKILKDYGIGEYVYSVYAKQGNTDWTSASQKGSAYFVAITFSDTQKGFVTKISGNYDKSLCIGCPDSIIGSGTSNKNLNDSESTFTGSSSNPDERTAYPLSGF